MYFDRNVRISVLPGSMKCADSGEPVAPSAERLRAAISAGRVLPYSVSAFTGWRKKPGEKLQPLPSGFTEIYRPDRIYGISSSNNSIGVISGQGGEYSSSRGFLSGDDAAMIAATFENNKVLFGNASNRNRSQTLYGLGLPNLAVWSFKHHMLRDPQRPLKGDKPYVNEGKRVGSDQYGNEGKWMVPLGYPYLKELGATAGKTMAHSRDQAHLFNHGYAYWLATGDPRAAILQQAIAAYSLASVYQGAYSDGRYRSRFGYQRSTANSWTAAWKLRDIALNASGPLLWPKSRSLKIVDDVMADWEKQIAVVDAGTDASSIMLRLIGSIDNQSGLGISNFMTQGYGPEAAYLWASAGRPKMLERLARQMVLRFGYIGGTRGVYGTASGSAFGARATSGGPITYSTVEGLAAYVNGNSTYPADSFDGAAQHTVMRAYWLLRLAKDAQARGWISPVKDIDLAISRMETARAKVAPNKDLGVIGWKHAGIPFAD
ncbi:MAG: hypothetical protein U9R73_01785 [Pseudomonadota bacterium]|nr:hypothetical protein [Pseudomonadota bacterium]